MATISLAINGRLAQCDQPRVIPDPRLTRGAVIDQAGDSPGRERLGQQEQCAENVDSPDARLEPRAAS